MGRTRSANMLAALAGATMTIGALAMSGGVAGAADHNERDDDAKVTFRKVTPAVSGFSIIGTGGGGTESCNETVTPWDTVTCIDPYFGTNQIYIDTTNFSANIVGHIELVGLGVDANTANVTYKFHSYVASGNFGSGTYCANFWKRNSDGSYTHLNSSCGSIV